MLTGLAAVTAPAAVAADNRSQADSIMQLSYRDFANLKNRGDRPGQFNWTDDGCSGPWGIKVVYRDLFNGPCQQHDFGYRNYGKGLQLGRNEDTRDWIDGRFAREMKRVCDTSFDRWWQKANKALCYSEAGHVWNAVRHGGRSAFYG